MTKHWILAGALLVALSPGFVSAAQVTPPAPQAPLAADDRGARDTRERLRTLLEQYPPSVRQVLRIDTSLLSRRDYLATYPTLAAFLDQHPEVVHNPAYFVGDSSGANQGSDQPADPRVEAARAWQTVARESPFVAVVFVITLTLAGLIRTLLDQRRWQRATRMQMDLHTKLIDRFSGNDELLAYTQSAVGRGLANFQAQAPAASFASRITDAPIGRLFWSLQSGIVLAAAGIGLLVVGARMNLVEMSLPFSGLGILALAVGAGFVVSAAVSYWISHRLGLMPTPRPADLDAPTPS